MHISVTVEGFYRHKLSLESGIINFFLQLNSEETCSNVMIKEGGMHMHHFGTESPFATCCVSCVVVSSVTSKRQQNLHIIGGSNKTFWTLGGLANVSVCCLSRVSLRYVSGYTYRLYRF